MYEFTLGITDVSPATWKRLEPQWADEIIRAGSSHSYFQVMNILCENAIKDRREYDHEIDEHLWNIKVMSMEDAMNPRRSQERLMRMIQGGGSYDDGNKKYTIICPANEEYENEDYDDPDSKILTSDTKLNPSILKVGTILKVTYDYGTTTTVYLKVLSLTSKAKPVLQYLLGGADSSPNMMEDLKSVPAYSLPKQDQVDAYFPHASKAFLGYYVPIFKSGDSFADAGENKQVMGSITLGLSAKVTSEKDTVFCTMKTRDHSSDLLFCPCSLKPGELLQVVNKAWKPRDRNHDSDGLRGIRYDWISRFVAPSADDEAYEKLKNVVDSASPFGPKYLLFRLAKDYEKSGFEFDKVFPKTCAMLTCGKFTWFKYEKGVLRVLVGRGVGNDDRQFMEQQVLKTWRHDFTSFHEMLCAVEASWVWNGHELSPNDIIPEYDIDLGPAKPLPKEPALLGKDDDFIAISTCSDKKKLVTALAISDEPNGKKVLYSGHDDGTLTKWSLDDNREIWSRRIYDDRSSEYDRGEYGLELHVDFTFGVAGIVVRPSGKKPNQPLIYTWSDNGYSYSDERDLTPSSLKVFSGVNGRYLHQYICDVGDAEDGRKAYPSISTVVFGKVHYRDHGYVDSILVGLHCCCNGFQYDSTFSNFDQEFEADYTEGNIVPFLEHATKGFPQRKALPTWRGQGGMIRAMAVIEESKYLMSLSIHPGHGLPDELVLWDLSQAGLPLHKIELYHKTRMHGVVGISVDGPKVLLADMYGDRIAAASVEEQDGEASMTLQGYANIGHRYYDKGFHGRMASSNSKYSIVAMESNPSAWIFKTQEASGHAKLDRNVGDRRNFDDEEYDEYGLSEQKAAREIAVGKVQFPLWGGNKPIRKKKTMFDGSWEFEDTSDGLGNGGPIQLAIRGRIVVAGFSNGTLGKIILPEQFEHESEHSMSSNHTSCCCALPSDEWNVPILECADDMDDDSEDDDFFTFVCIDDDSDGMYDDSSEDSEDE